MSAGSGTEQTNWITPFPQHSTVNRAIEPPRAISQIVFPPFPSPWRWHYRLFSKHYFFRESLPDRTATSFVTRTANTDPLPPPSSLRSAPSPSLVIFLAPALLPFFPRQESRKEITPQLHQKKFSAVSKATFSSWNFFFVCSSSFLPSFAKAGKRNVSQVPQRDSYPLH